MDELSRALVNTGPSLHAEFSTSLGLKAKTQREGVKRIRTTITFRKGVPRIRHGEDEAKRSDSSMWPGAGLVLYPLNGGDVPGVFDVDYLVDKVSPVD